MIVIRFMGGLGNQMFQYALYYAFEQLGKEVYADISSFEQFDASCNSVAPRVLELGYFKNIKLNLATEEMLEMCHSENKIKKYLLKLLGKKTFIYYAEESSADYDNMIWKLENAYLVGYWQNPSYFKNYSTEIRKRFCIDYYDLNRENQEIINCMEKKNSVSVHIRRGDYLKLSEIYGGICTEKYYREAMNEINEKVEHPFFYFFSDDIDWIKRNYHMDNMMVIDINKKEDSYKDMILMSKCKHNIICNSTFSWWGAWLNDNSEKIVISPSRFTNKELLSDTQKNDGWIYL